MDSTLAVKGTGNGPFTSGPSTSLTPKLAHGTPGIIPGGNYPVRVVVTVASETTEEEKSTDNVWEAGVHSPDEPYKSLGTKETCGCGSTTGTEPEELTKEACSKPSPEEKAPMGAVGINMTCSPLLSRSSTDEVKEPTA